MEAKTITVQTSVHMPVEKAWQYFTEPQHITQWYYASDDWHAPHAENDVRTNGKFLTRMEAKDGSMGFDFGGVYDKVDLYQLIEYKIGDGRKVSITFEPEGDHTTVVETFEPEATHPLEMQQGGWQAILDNYKKYAEASEK